MLFFPPSLEIEIVGELSWLWKSARNHRTGKINVSKKTYCSSRIVENIRFCNFFFHFHVVTVVLWVVTINTFLDSLALNIYGNIKYEVSYKSFNFIVNARTESCLQDVELGHEETVYLGSTLGLILNCFVKHYGSKFLISEQEALCLILEPYYDCFLVP